MKKILKISLIILFTGGLFYTLFYLYKKSHKKPAEYNLITPFKANIIKKTVATGSVVPRKEVQIVPRISGIIQKIYVQPGDHVKEGEIIAQLKVIPSIGMINDAENRLERAKIEFDNANEIYKRQKTLFDQQVISINDFQPYQKSLDNSKLELEVAENNLQIVKEGITKKAGTVTNTLVRSTCNGIVLDIPLKEGNSVVESNSFNSGTLIATIADMGNMIFKGKVDETEVGKLKVGMPLNLIIGAIEDQTFDAILEYISPKGKEESGAVQFEIQANMILKEGQFIRAGYSANANIELGKRDSVIAIPESILKFNDTGDSSFVEIQTKTPNVFKKQYVKTGLSDGINVEILKGITLDNKIKGSKKNK